MKLKKFNLKNIKIDKTKTLILVGIITLLLFVGGATYAYFAFSSAGSISGNMNIISNTVDNLIFNVEKDIYINANLENFGQGMSDLSDDTDATATLIPNNYDNKATAMYNIYLIIEANDLEYTTDNHTPELLLNVTDPNGTQLENITGLVHHENGFDITTRTGGFLIASDYVINSQDIATVQTWNVEITLANLDSNQNDNMNKTFSAKLYLTQEKMSSYNPVQVTSINASPTYNSIDTTLNLSNGTADAEKYYFGIEESNTTTGYINNNNGVVKLNNNILANADTVEYIESDTPNYKFTNLKENTEYTIYSYVVDANDIKSNVYETNITTSEYDLATIDSVEHSVTLNSITLTVNATSGDGTISKYMYSKDNGNSWEESTSNTHTFTGLNDTTEYKIKVKVVDSNNRESTEYYEAISTETYILPVVANVEYTTTYNSITLTPSGTDGTNVIDHYEYSINNGAYQTSNVFNNLNEQTEYTINVKAIDSSGRKSNPYPIQITTDTYQVPVISNVTTSSTTNSITINVSASNGDGTITTYMYSRDNGSNWYESTSNSYTFNNLTSNTTFYVQVKVVDNNNRESAVSNATIKTQYINPVVNSVSTSNVTSNSVTLTVSATAGSNNITTYYYSSNNGSSYVSSSSNTYTFSGLNASTTYNFRVYVVDNDGVKSNETTTSATTEIGTFANYIKTLYTVDGENNLYYHDGDFAQNICIYNNTPVFSDDTTVSTNSIACQNVYSGGDYNDGQIYYDSSGVSTVSWNSSNNICENKSGNEVNKDLDGSYGVSQDECYGYAHGSDLVSFVGSGKMQLTILDANDNSYRYIGADPNNYVCFGSDATICPDSNLYRIIGVFGNQVKLIKATSYLSYRISDSNITSWSESIVNTLILNNRYLNEFEATWSNKIATHTWYVGGYNKLHTISRMFYNAESSGTAWSGKIGLMYVSDYGFAASTSYWNTALDDYYDVIDVNWMYLGKVEWTISRNSSRTTAAFGIGGAGSVNTLGVDRAYYIRPTFYLNSNVTYVSGTGTQSDPIRIN